MPSEDARASIPFPGQPSPSELIVIHLPRQTVITRHWEAGDHRRCGLCPKGQCGATRDGVCTVVAVGFVPGPSAWLYRVTGL